MAPGKDAWFSIWGWCSREQYCSSGRICKDNSLLSQPQPHPQSPTPPPWASSPYHNPHLFSLNWNEGNRFPGLGKHFLLSLSASWGLWTQSFPRPLPDIKFWASYTATCDSGIAHRHMCLGTSSKTPERKVRVCEIMQFLIFGVCNVYHPQNSCSVSLTLSYRDRRDLALADFRGNFVFSHFLSLHFFLFDPLMVYTFYPISFLFFVPLFALCLPWCFLLQIFWN